MADGESLPDGEFWYRIVTRADFVVPGRAKLSEGALKDGALSRNENSSRAWAHHMSGRRSSECGDVDEHAQAYIEAVQQRRVDRGKERNPQFQFSGVAYQLAGPLRANIKERIRSDVVHTPTSADERHTSFVTFESTEDDLDEVRTWLQTLLIVSPPGAAHPFAQAVATAGPALVQPQHEQAETESGSLPIASGTG